MQGTDPPPPHSPSVLGQAEMSANLHQYLTSLAPVSGRGFAFTVIMFLMYRKFIQIFKGTTKSQVDKQARERSRPITLEYTEAINKRDGKC